VQLAIEFYAPIIPVVAELHRQGLSLRAIARELQDRGIQTRIWNKWSATQVRRVLQRAGVLPMPERPAKPSDPMTLGTTDEYEPLFG
jgi:hypothetical protein